MPDRRARHHRLREDETGEAFPPSALKLPARRLDVALFRSLQALVILISCALPNQVVGQSVNGDQATTNDNLHDIAVVIDNRLIADQPAAKGDVDALIEVIDRQMLIENIIRLQRPTIDVVCDIFGGCPDPEEIANPWPPLIWQITREDQARIVVYYLGRGRIEGNRRQLLFKRSNDSPPGDVVPYDVGWLHFQLADAKPKTAVVFMDTSFAPRPLPCASEDPLLIDRTMRTVRRNFRRTVAGKNLPKRLAELTATLPVEAPHCDRYDLILDGVKRPLFTKFLLKGIADGEADKEPYGDQNTIIELAELTAYTDDKIKRAVRFQWGRLQHVWRIGPASRRLASTVRRPSTQHRSQVNLAKTEPAGDLGESSKGGARRDGSQRLKDEGATGQRPGQSGDTPIENCRNDPDGTTCHPCVVNPGSDACKARCQTGRNVDLCAGFLTSSTEITDALATQEIVKAPETEETKETAEADPCADRPESPECAATWCRRSARTAGPAATKLLEVLQRDKEGACRWAAGDHNPEDQGWLSKIFTPIGWKLSRQKVRDSVYCLLDCDRLVARPASPKADEPAKPAANKTPAVERAEPDAQTESAPATKSQGKTAPTAEKKAPDPQSAEPTPMAGRGSEKPPPSKSPSPPIETAKQIKPAPAPKTFKPSVSEIRWLQSALTVDNHNPGPIDGSLGPMTMEAVRSWRHANKASSANDMQDGAQPDPLTKDEFNAILTAFGARFGQVQRGASLF